MSSLSESSQSALTRPGDDFFRIGLIALTPKCNLNCIMCFEKNEASSYHELGFDEFKKLVDSLKVRGVSKIVFIGGECTLMGHIHEYVKYVSDSGIQPHCTTNGTPLAYESRMKKLLDSGLRGVEFSFHSHINKDAGLISGRGDTLKQQLQALENFAALSSQYNPPPDVHVNTVITRINLPYLDELVAFYVNNFGIKSFSLKAPSIEGNMRINKELVPDFSLVSPVLEKISAFSEAAGAKMILDGFPLCMIPPHLIPMTIPFIDSGSILEGWNYHPRIHRRRFDSIPQEKILPECARCIFAPICQGFNSSYLAIFPETSAVPVASFQGLDEDVFLSLTECLRLTSLKDFHEAAWPENIDNPEAFEYWASKHIRDASKAGANKIRFLLGRDHACAHDSLSGIIGSSVEAGLKPVIVAYGHLFNNERFPEKPHGFSGLAEAELIFHSTQELKHHHLSGGSDFKEDCRGMLVLLRMNIPVSIKVPVVEANANGLKNIVKLAGISRVKRIVFELSPNPSCQGWPFTDGIRDAVEYSLSEYPELRVELKGFPCDVLPERGYLHKPLFINS